MRRSHALAISCLLAIPARPAASSAQSDSRLWPPAVVADSFFRATRDARWLDAAGFLDLDAVSAMRDQRVRSARNQPAIRKITAETYLEFDPKMPREVAEYQARQHNERAAEIDPLMYEYARVPSIDSLARLPRAEVAARWLEARDVRWGLRRSMLDNRRRRGCNIPLDSIDSVIRAMQLAPTRIIGTVIDDSIAHVLHDQAFIQDEADSIRRPARSHRQSDPGSYLIPPSVMTLRRVGSGWRIVPAFESAGAAFVSNVECSAAGNRNDR